MRVVSLIASATEMICALGAQDLLVGRSHECDYPESVRALPSCTEIKFDPGLKSYQIDERIKGILQEGLSVYRVHAETLRELRPDIIVTQIQCQVCAVSQQDVEDAVREWLGPKGLRDGHHDSHHDTHQVQIVSLNPNSLDDIWTDIRKIAEALKIPRHGEELISKLQNRLGDISKKAKQARSRPRIACIEWIDPLMAAGNWNPEIIEIANGENLFGLAKQHSPYMKFEDLIQSDPDVILISPCGFDIARTQQELPPLINHPQWKNLRAVREGRVYLADGNQYFNRPGPRVVEATQILAEILHPEIFEPVYQERGWVRWI